MLEASAIRLHLLYAEVPLPTSAEVPPCLFLSFACT